MEPTHIPVKVLDELVRAVMRWIEVNRPLDAGREAAAEWILSAAFSSVSVAGAACAGLQAFGEELGEEQFVSLAREAYRRAHARAPQAKA